MSVSRRTIVVHGSVIGVGAIAGGMSGIAALAAGQPPLRRSLQGLAWNDPIVATYRDAVGIMKQMKDSEKFSWTHLATIHGSDPNTDHFCPHGDWYFLPWHRAYTAMYERIVRHLTKNDAFAMPYWDWTNDPKMPDVFLQPKTPDGKTNWLYVSEPGWQRTWPPNKPMPAEIVGPAVLKAILSATTYEQFGTSRNPAQTDLDPKWVPAGGGVQGILEGTPHNQVHNNIGGWMPSMSSPRDPIFFMHHSNIDRIWAVWNLRNKNSDEHLWKDMPFKDNFYNVNGSFWSPKVSDLYHPETLGYTYGLPKAQLVASEAPSITAFNEKLLTLNKAPDLSKAGAGLTTTVVANTATATTTAPLSLSVAVGERALTSVRSRRTLGAGSELMDFNAAQEVHAEGAHVIAILRDVKVTDPHTTMFRVFLDMPDVTAETPITDPHYVGTFGVFHHQAVEGSATMDMPSFALDLTDTLERLTGSATATDKITVQLIPVAGSDDTKAVGTATPSQLEVIVLAA